MPLDARGAQPRRRRARVARAGLGREPEVAGAAEAARARRRAVAQPAVHHGRPVDHRRGRGGRARRRRGSHLGFGRFFVVGAVVFGVPVRVVALLSGVVAVGVRVVVGDIGGGGGGLCGARSRRLAHPRHLLAEPQPQQRRHRVAERPHLRRPPHARQLDEPLRQRRVGRDEPADGRRAEQRRRRREDARRVEHVRAAVAPRVPLDVHRHPQRPPADGVPLEVERLGGAPHERLERRVGVHAAVAAPRVARSVAQRAARRLAADRQRRHGGDAVAAAVVDRRAEREVQPRHLAAEQRPQPLELVPRRLGRGAVAAEQPLVVARELEEHAADAELLAAGDAARPLERLQRALGGRQRQLVDERAPRSR